MIINWAEKQAPEDRQATEDVDAMTQYRFEEQEAFVSLRTSKSWDNLELYKAVIMLREDDWTEPKDRRD